MIAATASITECCFTYIVDKVIRIALSHANINMNLLFLNLSECVRMIAHPIELYT
jgi:hypothetical protein